ncbi:hypothetical protein ACODUL_18980 [Stenotrophomonas maltophilia]
MALIALDDPRWAELQHAYGAADDIPELLANLSIPRSMSSALLTSLALAHGNTGVARMLGQITAYEADEAVDLFLNR